MLFIFFIFTLNEWPEGYKNTYWLKDIKDFLFFRILTFSQDFYTTSILWLFFTKQRESGKKRRFEGGSWWCVHKPASSSQGNGIFVLANFYDFLCSFKQRNKYNRIRGMYIRYTLHLVFTRHLWICTNVSCDELEKESCFAMHVYPAIQKTSTKAIHWM